MDRMDYQMDSAIHTAPQHQNSNPPRCPYRTQANIPTFASQHQHPHFPFNPTNREYIPLAVHSNIFGDGLPRHAPSANPNQYGTPTTSLGSVYAASSSQRNATEPGGFEYTAGGLNPTAPPYHGQARHNDQEILRPSHQSSSPSGADGIDQANAARDPEPIRTTMVGQTFPSRFGDMSPYHSEWMAHRVAHPAPSSTNDPQRLRLPVPAAQISQDDAQRPYSGFYQQTTHPNPTPVSSQVPSPSTTIRQAGSAERRAFRLFTALGVPTAHVATAEDDDSTEEQDDILDHAARAYPEHPEIRMQHFLSQMGSGSYLLGGHSDAARETLNRAARRGAAAAVKMVASTNVLASFEKVEKDSLKPEDQLCVICYNEFGVKNPDGFTEHPVRLPACKHLFGDQCLKQWLKDSDSCPYCRDKLESEPKRAQLPSDPRSRLTFGLQQLPDASSATRPSEAQEVTRERELLRGLQYDQEVGQFLQERLLRDAAAREAHIRHHGYDAWNSSALPLSPLTRGPLFSVDANGEARRRARARVNAGRASSTNNRLAMAVSTRSTRGFGQSNSPLRTPNRNSTPGEGFSATQNLTSVSPGDSQSSASPTTPTTSARPSSVPSERSALHDVGDSRQEAFRYRGPLDTSYSLGSLPDAAPVGDQGSRPTVNDGSVSTRPGRPARRAEDPRVLELITRYSTRSSR